MKRCLRILVLIVAFGANASEAPRTEPLPLWTNWRQLESIAVGHGHLTGNDVSVDGRFALVVSEEEALIRVYDLKTLRSVGAYPVPGFEKYGAIAAAFWPLTPETPRILCGTNQGLALYDTTTGTCVQKLSCEPVYRIRWSGGHDLVMCASAAPGNRGAVLRFYRVNAPAGLTQVDSLESPDRIADWDLNEAKNRLAVVTIADELQCYDWKGQKLLWTAAAPKYANAVKIAPDGSRIACGGDRLTLYDTIEPTKTASFAGFNNNVDSIVFAPTGDALFASSYDGRIRILGAGLAQAALPLLHELKHSGTANVYSLTLYANGARLLSSSGDKTIRIWGVPERPTAARAGGK